MLYSSGIFGDIGRSTGFFLRFPNWALFGSFYCNKISITKKKSQAAYLDHCFMQSRFVKIFSCLNCCIRLTRK